MIELGPGEKAFLSLQLPAEFVIIFDPVTHAAQFIDVKGEPNTERQSLSMVISRGQTPNETLTMRPGPLRLSLENHTDTRVLPGLWIAGHDLHHLLGQRRGRFGAAGQLDAAYAVGASSAQPGLLGPRTFSRVQHGPDNRAGYYEH
jgi:uncharacterized protein DUF5939